MPRRRLHEFSTTGMDTDFFFSFSSLHARVCLPYRGMTYLIWLIRVAREDQNLVCLSNFGEFHWGGGEGGYPYLVSRKSYIFEEW